MAITPLPTPPSRNDPANFATRADAFMAALPAFATETNATAVEVDNDRIASAASAATATTQVGLATTQVGLASAQRVLAEAAANAASATANAVQWVSGTTYTIGQNVWSPLDYQTYRRITNGAGTTDPTLDIVNWTKLTGSAGGFGAGATVYTNVTTKTTYTLTSSSTSVIEIESKVFGNIVKLPDATGMSKGKGLFNIRNSGSLPFVIEDFAGNFLGGVAGATEVSVSLNTNTTQAGTWDLTDVACRSVESTQLGISLLTVNTGGGTYGLQTLNSTQFVIFGTFTSYALSFQVITYDAGTNSFSASSVYSVVPSSYSFGGECVRIGTSNRFFAISRNSGTHYGYVIDLTTPNSPVIGSETTLVTDNNTTYTAWGSTITNNGEPFGKSRYTVPVKGSPHKLVNCYENTTTGQLAGYVINCGTSGTTITVGSPSNFPDASTANQYPQINALTSFATDKIGAIFRHYDGGTYSFRGTIGTVSGNSITWSNSSTIHNNGTQIVTAALGATQTLWEQDKFVIYTATTGVANIITFATGGMTVGTAIGVPSGTSGQIIVTKNGFMIYTTTCGIASYTYSGSDITNVTGEVSFGASAATLLSSWTNANADAVAIGSNNATYFVKQDTDGSMQLNQIGSNSNRVLTYSINASGKHAVIAYTINVANINAKYMFGSVATNGRFSPEKVIARVDQGYGYSFQTFYLQVAQKLWSELANGQLRGFTFTGQESNPVYIGESGFRDFLTQGQVTLFNSTELSSSLIVYATSTSTVESVAPVRISLIRHN